MAINILKEQTKDLSTFSHNHAIKRSRDDEDGVPPQQNTTLPSLVAIGIAELQV